MWEHRRRRSLQGRPLRHNPVLNSSLQGVVIRLRLPFLRLPELFEELTVRIKLQRRFRRTEN